ncbi:translesion DNA synthesis-associated protein ImuA [Rhizobacter sp. OV335]|uniref:translesion DNA synthesis-associated protein ImuA n=1 Tax=Rhizobacter sp. OV335 TaxID=1500264 RepID=UPI000937AE5C|nr:translesion DNA synthesis-associated protein ImuA [Rhizobacter sp. OV335]
MPRLPTQVEAAVWRADQIGNERSRVLPTGFQALDQALPGGGWPCASITEVLQLQPTVAEWRLLGPALKTAMEKGVELVLIGPPKLPHLPGLRLAGIDERRVIWVQAESPAQRLWTTEQLIKANTMAVLMAWLPQVRPEQLRRLQVCAASADSPVFLFRPASAQHQASAAPLRLIAEADVDWQLHVRVLKRRGPTIDETLTLRSVPAGLDALITPRIAKPSSLFAARRRHQHDPLQTFLSQADPDVVGSLPSASSVSFGRRAPAH